jgi:uncharacterized protein (DUF934 family)
MKLIKSPSQATGKVVTLANDASPLELTLDGVDCVELQFPKFTDGRAYSQAFLLRRRLGFSGDIRATGDVLIDQLVQMQRTGFSSAVLREGQDHSGRAVCSGFAVFLPGRCRPYRNPILQRRRNHGSDTELNARPSQRLRAESWLKPGPCCAAPPLPTPPSNRPPAWAPKTW